MCAGLTLIWRCIEFPRWRSSLWQHNCTKAQGPYLWRILDCCGVWIRTSCMRQRRSWRSLWLPSISELELLKPHAMPLSGFTFASASGWAYGGVEGGYTYLLPGSISVVVFFIDIFCDCHHMIRMPSVLLMYWVLAGLLAKTLGVIMLFASLLCHLAFPIFVHTLTLVWSKFSRQPHSC